MKFIEKAHLYNFVSISSPNNEVIAIGNNFSNIVLYNLISESYTILKCSDFESSNVISLKTFKNCLLALVDNNIFCWNWINVLKIVDIEKIKYEWCVDIKNDTNLNGNFQAISLYVDESSEKLFTGLSTGEIQIWCLQSSTPVHIGTWFNKSAGMLLCLEGTGPVSNLILSGYENGSVIMWEISKLPSSTRSNKIKGTPIDLENKIQEPITVIKSSLNNDSKISDWIVIGGKGGLILWNHKICLIGSCMKSPSSDPNWTAICVAIIGEYIIAGGDRGSHIGIWNFAGQLCAEIIGSDDCYDNRSFSSTIFDSILDIVPINVESDSSSDENVSGQGQFLVCGRSSTFPIFSVMGYLKKLIEL